MPIAVLEKWIEDGSFNPERMAEGDYSCTTAIVIVLNPNAQGTALENACIGLVVRWHKAPVGQIATVLNLIKYAHSLMEVERQSSKLIPRACQFPPDLLPQIVILRNHATPNRDPKTGEEVPFVTIGHFTSKDTLFCGVTRDLELYTAEEVITLRNMGIFKSLSTNQSTPKLPSLASLGQALSSPPDPKVTPCSPKVELDSSSKKRDHKSSSKSHKCPVSAAAGSHADLEKSEQECEAAFKQLEWRA